MVSFDPLVGQFITGGRLGAASIRLLGDGRLWVDPTVSRAVCGMVRLLDPVSREALVDGARGFDPGLTQAVLSGLHPESAWSPEMLGHVTVEAALILLVAAKLGVIEE